MQQMFVSLVLGEQAYKVVLGLQACKVNREQKSSSSECCYPSLGTQAWGYIMTQESAVRGCIMTGGMVRTVMERKEILRNTARE